MVLLTPEPQSNHASSSSEPCLLCWEQEPGSLKTVTGLQCGLGGEPPTHSNPLVSQGSRQTQSALGLCVCCSRGIRALWYPGEKEWNSSRTPARPPFTPCVTALGDTGQPSSHTHQHGKGELSPGLCFLTSLSNAMRLALFPFSRGDTEARSLKNLPRCHTTSKPPNWYLVPGMPDPGGQALPSHQAARRNRPVTVSCCCSHPQDQMCCE